MARRAAAFGWLLLAAAARAAVLPRTHLAPHDLRVVIREVPRRGIGRFRGLGGGAPRGFGSALPFPLFPSLAAGCWLLLLLPLLLPLRLLRLRLLLWWWRQWPLLLRAQQQQQE